MQRPPRHADESLFGWPQLAGALVQGGWLLAATLAIDVIAISAGRDADTARALTVLALTAGNLGLVALNVAGTAGLRVLLGAEGRAVRMVAAVATAALALAIAWPPARTLLHFGLPAAGDVTLALVVTAAAVVLGTRLAPASGRR